MLHQLIYHSHIYTCMHIHTAFPAWSTVPATERAAFLLRIADEIEKHSAEFALAESKDTGKPLTLATNVDIDRGVHNFRFFAEVLLAQGECTGGLLASLHFTSCILLTY